VEDTERLAIEVGWPIATALPGDGAIGLGTIGGGTVARTIHRGPYERIGTAFAALADWIGRHGYAPTGAPWETYLNTPETVADPSELVTTISWPIR
jgi:effector-binding domain-containing protein